MQVHHPSGATEVTRLHAPRPPTLAGKRVALLSDDMWQAHRMLPLVKASLESRYRDIVVLPETDFPMGNALIDRDETADLMVAQGIDAVVVGNAA